MQRQAVEFAPFLFTAQISSMDFGIPPYSGSEGVYELELEWRARARRCVLPVSGPESVRVQATGAHVAEAIVARGHLHWTCPGFTLLCPSAFRLSFSPRSSSRFTTRLFCIPTRHQSGAFSLRAPLDGALLPSYSNALPCNLPHLSRCQESVVRYTLTSLEDKSVVIYGCSVPGHDTEGILVPYGDW